MNEKTTTCHDCHDFKWKNINFFLILTNFVYSPKPFFNSLDCDYSQLLLMFILSLGIIYFLTIDSQLKLF
jgi:hypothetical protein